LGDIDRCDSVKIDKDNYQGIQVVDFDDKDLAIIALMFIAFAVLYTTKAAGLNVVSNIVCGLVGFVTGKSGTRSKGGI